MVMIILFNLNSLKEIIAATGRAKAEAMTVAESEIFNESKEISIISPIIFLNKTLGAWLLFSLLL
jgi:hypothetical protein